MLTLSRSEPVGPETVRVLRGVSLAVGAGESVALIIADQWMPEIKGIELLGRAHEIHPAAQRALLVDWGDRSAAPAILEGCAFGQLENYLRRPWFPPEVHLYPAIGEFLADWTRAHGPRMELVQVIGDDPSRRTHDVREFLDYVHERGVIVDNLTTNAALLTPEIAQRLTKYRAREVVVSFPCSRRFESPFLFRRDHPALCKVETIKGWPASATCGGWRPWPV